MWGFGSWASVLTVFSACRASAERGMELLSAFPLSLVNFFGCACALVSVVISAYINWVYNEKFPLPICDRIVFVLATYMLPPPFNYH